MRYVELHCKSNFSFLEGASHAAELVKRADELGYDAMAVTDRNTLAGIVRAHSAARRNGIKLIIGAEITPVDAPPVVLWAMNRKGYGQLCRLITVGRRRAKKGECKLTFSDVAAHSEGLLAGVGGRSVVAKADSISRYSVRPGPFECEGAGASAHVAGVSSLADFRAVADSSPVAGGRLNPVLQTPTRTDGMAGWCHEYRDVFGDRCYLLAELHNEVDDDRLLENYIRLSKETRIPLVAAGDVHFHAPARLPLQHALTCIRHGVTLDQAGSLLFPNADRCLQPFEQIERKYRHIPEAISRTVEIAGRCSFNMDELRYEYPREVAPGGMAPNKYLRELTWQGADHRYPDGVPPRVRKLIGQELALIEKLKYEAFFLTVYDAVRFARTGEREIASPDRRFARTEQEILCQGRGSAANSAVCYCLGVTSVDPNQTEVLFGRFISEERNEAPDIDVDFEHERREEVLQYLYDKYGRDRAGIAATVITYRLRSAVRDIGKVLGLSLDKIDALAKNVGGHWGSMDQLLQGCRDAGVDPDSMIGKRLIHLVTELVTGGRTVRHEDGTSQVGGFPRHLSQHVGGMVITEGPLCELVPIENAAMDGRTVVEWDKDDLEELGILKVDCLCLGMLTAIRKGFDLIEQQTGERWSLATIPQEDPIVYDMICNADVIGCFQIESRAQMSMLPRLKPRTYYDLVIEVAIVRPGPIKGGMVHPFLKARNAGRALYPDEHMKEVLGGVLDKTMGVPIFQEQVMRLAMEVAGFSPGEADQLRRAMGAWGKKGDLLQFHSKLMEGMRRSGLSDDFAEKIFEMIKGFGDYGFPESHSASFALLAYASCWIKCYHQAAFTTALLNSQPMGFYRPAQLVQDARRHDVSILPVDVNYSDWDCTMPDQNTIRLGFRMVKGLASETVETVVRCRRHGKFKSMEDFFQRTGLARAATVKLSEADAFGSLDISRRRAYWDALGQEKSRHPMPLINPCDHRDEKETELPRTPLWAEVCDDYGVLGLTLRDHPLSFLREELERRRAISANELVDCADNRLVRLAGIVTGRQRPSTAKGVTFATLEDETGFANLVIFRNVWEKYSKVLRHSNFWFVTGKLQRESNVIHVVVESAIDFSPWMDGLSTKARDFR